MVKNKTQKAKKEKPKYNTLQNVGWMVKIAWKNGKRVLLFCALTAILEGDRRKFCVNDGI